MSELDRVAALREQDPIYDWLYYYLGPTGIPDKLRGVAEGVDMISPVSAYGRSVDALKQGNYGTAGLEMLGMAAPAGIAAYLTRLGAKTAPLAGRALSEAEEAAKALFGADLLPQGNAGETGAEALLRMTDNVEPRATDLGPLPAPTRGEDVVSIPSRADPVAAPPPEDDLIDLDALDWAAEDFPVAPPNMPPVEAAPVAPPVETFDENGFLRLDDLPPSSGNGGPPLTSTPGRYINPTTGLYSPSYEAAKSLKQEVGTPEQMRSMLLKAGAKEEELLYSGFDDWLKGKTGKVTKQEITDVLGLSAAGVSDQPIYVRQPLISGGVTGIEGKSLGDLQDQIYEDLLERYSFERSEKLMSGLMERGYRTPEITDEASFREFAERVRQQRDSYDPRDSGPRVPGSVSNVVNRIQYLLDSGRSFDDYDIERLLMDGITNNEDVLVRPDGRLTYADDAVYDEFPDERFGLNVSRGNMPEEVRDRAAEAYRMSAEDAADYLGVDLEDVLNSFNPDETIYGQYAPPGLWNYTENLYKFDDAGRGVVSALQDLGASRFENPHFASSQGKRAPIMLHTRTGELQTPDGPAHHVAEVQSDLAQTYNEKPGDFVLPGQAKLPEPTDLDRRFLEGYIEEAKKVQQLNKEADAAMDKVYDDFLDEFTGALLKDAPGYAERAAEVKALREELQRLRQNLVRSEEDNWDLFKDLSNSYGGIMSYDTLLTGGNINLDRLSEVLSGKAKPKRGYGLAGKTAALPFASSTNRWVDTALKNELIAAAKKGAEWITFPLGEDVVKYTYGEVKGQTEFYEGILMNRLKGLSKKFLDGAKIEKIEARGFGGDNSAPRYRVNGIRLTPELRRKILEEGLPSFAKGGPVTGSSLDVDVFALD